ncbi:hypothetical protein [Actinomadura verrucosospora]|uniref:Uncharacterized protein n=1 Tax=Actinomadura verrucosospora TaxID=46165 RepID=A0A7D4AT45_ACTVE|nr:hypothetical protein [Actinomadura verrucosospora]QKG24369.1 Hypothetical protein ACTIVE_6016 [Actinomadura verrucosospora]
MSGAKVISVDAAAWRDAQASARDLAKVRRDMPRLLRQVERAAREDVERARREAAARQDGTDRALAGLSEQAKRLEDETGRRLREHGKRLAEGRRELAAQGERLAADIARERAERRAGLAAVDARVGELRGESDAAAAAAHRLFEDARTMRDAIRGMLPHDRFAPGRLDRLASRLDVAQANLEAHAAGYSLSQVQDLYLDLSELRADVERLALEWEALRAEALAALRTVAATIEENAERPVADADPGTVLDVDHWTDGALGALRDEVARQVDLVADPACPLDAAELRALIAEAAPEYEGRLDALVGRAAERIVASQLRVNVAEQVVAVLEGQGFAWSGNTYAAGDERRAFFSRLRHRADGGEVVVEVAPDGGDGAGFTLRILSYEDDPDEAARRERSAAVSRALRAEGLDAGEPAEEGGEPDPALRDFAALSRPAPGGQDGRNPLVQRSARPRGADER